MIEWVTENWSIVGFGVTGLLYLLTAAAAYTPNKSDDAAVQFIWDAWNKVAWNRGKATNAPEA
jgi:hypothetical protein